MGAGRFTATAPRRRPPPAIYLGAVSDPPAPDEPPGSDGPPGPVEAAQRWIKAVMEEGDWEAAWWLTDPVLRLAHAQAWLWANREEPELAGEDLDELAESLCTEGSFHPLWDDFAEMALATYDQTWQEFDLQRWTVAGESRLIGPDLEVVLFVRAAENPIVVTEPALVVARPFLMRFTDDGWLVAHAGSNHLPVPGWPPEFPSATFEE